MLQSYLAWYQLISSYPTGCIAVGWRLDDPQPFPQSPPIPQEGGWSALTMIMAEGVGGGPGTWNIYVCVLLCKLLLVRATLNQQSRPRMAGTRESSQSNKLPWKIQRFPWIKNRGFVFRHCRPPCFGWVCFPRISMHINLKRFSWVHFWCTVFSFCAKLIS